VQISPRNSSITSIPGIGSIVAASMIKITDDFNKLDTSDKFSCYAGVVPFEHHSGSSILCRSKVSDIANKKIKTLLHMAAM
jgi:transposase